jgi:hypothetical protein
MASSRLSLTPAPDRRNDASREALLMRVRGEFTEMPCLRLTRGQAQRLFDLRPDICERVLATLVRDQTLICGIDGRYRVTDIHLWRDDPTVFQHRTMVAPKAS